jgi:SAM-dependent methyltransferase
MAIKNKAINYRLPLCYEMSSAEIQQIKGVLAQLRRGDLPTDLAFDACMPLLARRHTSTHFTPVDVAVEAAQFLCSGEWPNPKILDVGSGMGKFCLVAGAMFEQAHFTGVEQRKGLCDVADVLLEYSDLNNVGFLCGNIMNVRFADFQGVYLYNPFYEHLQPFSAIDESIELDADYYEIYCGYVRKQLQSMPKGTRVVTYFGGGDEIPLNYDLVKQSFHNDLKCWQKR